MTGILNILAGALGVAKDTYFNLVSLLLPGNGTNGKKNNDFVDSSTANSGSGWPITPNGDVTQGTFSPFSQTGWGNYLPTTSDRLTTSASNSGFSFGTGDFTIEGWMYPTAATEVMLFQMSTASTGYNPSFSNTIAAYVSASSKFEIYANGANNASTNAVFSSSNINQWHHFAIVRSSGTTKVYFDGTVITGLSSISDSTNYSMTYCVIGTVYDNSYSLKGYLSNLRVVKGRAVYTANFTPPTSPLGKTSGGVNPPQGTECVFLTAQSNRFRDSSDSNIGLNISGSPSVAPFSPFAPTQAYSASAVGGSGYFDGSGDYLTAPTNAAFNLGTANFTIEWSFYYSETPPAGGYDYLFGMGANATTGIALYIDGGVPKVWNGSLVLTSSQSVVGFTWYHLALVRSSGTLTMYLNGTSVGSVSFTSNLTGGELSSGPSIGTWSPVDLSYFPGYISNFRIVKGTAIVPPAGGPTSPLTAVSGTSLLLNFTNAGVVDATAKNVLETEGNAQISTAQSKWGGGSIAFDGSSPNDYLRSPTTFIFSGDFVIEGWMYFSSASSGFPTILCASTANQLQLQFDSTGANYYLNFGGTSSIINNQPTGMSTNTWTHFAVVRSGTASNNISVYFNGTRKNQATSTASVSQTIFLGADSSGTNPFNGYLDDFRITVGTTRGYSGASITVPTAPFPLQ